MKVRLALLLLVATSVHGQGFTQSYTSTSFISANTVQVAAGDFRHKGYADLVVATGNQVCVLPSNGDGTFASPNCFGNVPELSGVAVGDTNGDGNLDIAAIGQQNITVFLGDGAGNFTSINPADGSSMVGRLSGPFIGNFAGAISGNNAGILLAAGNCGTAAVGTDEGGQGATQFQDSTTVGVALESTSIIATNVSSSDNSGYNGIQGCDGEVIGVVRGVLPPSFFCPPSGQQAACLAAHVAGDAGIFRGEGNFLFEDTTNGFAPLNPCDPNQTDGIGVGQSIVWYESTGNFCVQNILTGAVTPGVSFSLTGDQELWSVSAINMFNGDVGLIGLIHSPTTQTGVSIFYGATLGSTSNSVSATLGLSQPTAFVVDNFRSNDTGQDFAVIDASRLKVFTQGTFTGAFSQAVSFQAQPENTSGTQTVTYQNTGTEPLSPLSVTILGSQDFTQSNNCPASLAVGGSCTITVTFEPLSVETNSSATLTAASTFFSSTDAVSGSETPFVDAVPAPASLTFPDQDTNTTSAAQTVQISNTGNETFSGSVTVPAGFKETNNCSSVASGASCTVSVAFAPTSMGTFLGNLVLTTMSSGAFVPLSGTGVLALGISQQPVNQTVLLGASATFFVVLSGTPPYSYQWTKNNSALAGATSATYTTPPTVAADSGAAFAVNVTDVHEHTTSNAATLTLDFPPVITVQPVASQTGIAVGTPVVFSVTATGTNLSYQWTRNGVQISGATGSQYSFTTQLTDVGTNNFACIVSSVFFPSITSAASSLTVGQPPSTTSGGAVLTGLGQTLSLSVQASGTGTLSYQWSENGKTIPAVTQNYSQVMTAADNGATFICAIKNSFGSTTATFNVTFTIAPVITFVSGNVSANIDASVTFGVNVNAPVFQLFSYQWFKNSVLIPGQGGTAIPAPSTNPGSSVASVSLAYTLLATAADNGAEFTLQVSNGAGTNVSSEMLLTVLGIQPPPSPSFTLTLAPTAQTIKAGGSAAYTLTVASANINTPVALSCSTNIPSGACTLSQPTATSGQVSVMVYAPVSSAGIPLLAVLLLTLLLVRKQKYLALLVLVACGCGGGSVSAPAPPAPVSQTYTVTVQGTDSPATTQVASTTLVVTN